ncbi:MAG: SDR family NAD(P)-dependent oxidoreductase [Clostridia bacterium]|nr:SDR family NAD(P)-dependent oxidoreductase [Clostridia bacterium]
MRERRNEAPIALITGSLGGLGSEFARIHASRGGDLILVDIDRVRLEAQKRGLESIYGVTAHTIAADLSSYEEIVRVHRACRDRALVPDFLILNAGFGGQGDFSRRSAEKDLAMLRVDAEAPTLLMKLFLPDLLKRSAGRILLVSSVAAKMPGPLQAVYFASKAYLYSLGSALWRELKGTGVTCTTLLPGVLDTDFADKAHAQDTALFKNRASPRLAAEKGYDGMLRGALTVTAAVPGAQKLLIPLLPFLPRRLVLEFVYRRQQKESTVGWGRV